MFDKIRAAAKVRRWMEQNNPHAEVKSLCGYNPYSIHGRKGTPYMVLISRGYTDCPMVEFAGERAYEDLRQKYRAEIEGRGYRGYHVSVDKVERLNVW